MVVEGKPVVVVGLARSGVAAALLLAGRGEAVVATDRKGPGELQEEVLRLEAAGVRVELGGHEAATFARASRVVVSPGVPFDLPELGPRGRPASPVVAEIELAFEHLTGTVAAITGTKGKSTTTAALGAMLREAGRDVRVGGNIGEALSSLVDGSTPDTFFAVEVSSFQLEGIVRFRPHVAVFLNLSADHLDRHPSFEAYAAAKARIFSNQEGRRLRGGERGRPAGARPGPRRPRAARALLPAGRGPRATARSSRRASRGSGRAGRTKPSSPSPTFSLPGAHLAADLLAAATAARLLGVPQRRHRPGGEGLPRGRARARARGHPGGRRLLQRQQGHQRRRRGPRAWPPSRGPCSSILGGRYKGGDFGLLAPALRAHGKRVLAIGEAQERIARSLDGVVPVDRAASLEDALDRARASAAPGDVVLLAPACSSFDMFRDYADRGRRFKDEVRRLAATAPSAGRARG